MSSIKSELVGETRFQLSSGRSGSNAKQHIHCSAPKTTFQPFVYSAGEALQRILYFQKIVPLSLIAFMSWIVFWIDPREMGSQIGISTASVLTLIMFQFQLGRLIPEISYFTRADHFSGGCIGVVFLALAQVATTTVLTACGHHSVAVKIDKWARFVFPMLFIAKLVIAFFI